MALSIFADKNKAPKEQAVTDALKDNFSVWAEIISFVNNCRPA